MRTMQFVKSFESSKRTLPRSAEPGKARFPRAAQKF